MDFLLLRKRPDWTRPPLLFCSAMSKLSWVVGPKWVNNSLWSNSNTVTWSCNFLRFFSPWTHFSGQQESQDQFPGAPTSLLQILTLLPRHWLEYGPLLAHIQSSELRQGQLVIGGKVCGLPEEPTRCLQNTIHNSFSIIINSNLDKAGQQLEWQTMDHLPLVSRDHEDPNYTR